MIFQKVQAHLHLIKENFYSIKDEILIDKSEMTYNIEYVKSEELNKGEYQVIFVHK